MTVDASHVDICRPAPQFRERVRLECYRRRLRLQLAIGKCHEYEGCHREHDERADDDRQAACHYSASASRALPNSKLPDRRSPTSRAMTKKWYAQTICHAVLSAPPTVLATRYGV